MPRFHNPLGTSFTEKDKKRIVALAEKYDVYIVEDDYLVDLDHQTNVLPAHFYDVSGKVIYVKSFSKAFMPGIRLGAVVMNKALQQEFLIHKKCADVNTSVLAQGALELFINSGMYKKQIRKARLEYGKKMACLRECVTDLKSTDIEFAVPDMGFFVWIRLNEEIDRAKLISRLNERNVYIASPDKNYLDHTATPNENSFGICIAKLSTEQIRVGVRMIREEAEVLSERSRMNSMPSL
ncbi:UNVERIFIED_CONTAM: DNA-binding transcriptional MocR family regulator [Brevibacillus sp. OAP136]